MKKKFFLWLVLLVIGLMSLSWYKNASHEDVHYHAGFLMYVDGVLQDYSDTKYMQIAPCAAEGMKQKKDEQVEKAHLHNNIGNVVHVHRNTAKWKDLLVNMQVTLPKDAKITLYTQGSNERRTIDTPITPYESIIITVGNTDAIDFSTYVSREHIELTEKNTESC